MDDMALLREYATRNSEAAFETLVSRRIGFVYSAALRQVRNPHLAEEITQVVFIILAQKAGRISDKTNLTGWLFKTTRFATLAQMRAAAKRQRREQEAQMQSELQSTAPDPLWEQMSPLLDEALATLGETDRQAMLLRFFENKSLAEVGNHLGTGEDTARKRVARALEKLHRYFSKRGVSSTTAIIAGTISAHSVQAAPVALAKSVTAVALAKGAAAGGSTLTLIKGALKIMAWTKAKTAIVLGVGVLLAVGTTTAIIKKSLSICDSPWKNMDNVLEEINKFVRTSKDDDGGKSFSTRLNNVSNESFKKAPLGIIIQQSHFTNSNKFFCNLDGNPKMIRRMVSFSSLLADAYCSRINVGFPTTRIIFQTDLPEGNFDYLVNVPDHGQEKFRAKIKQQFGLIGRMETLETSVFLLKLKNPAAPGLRFADQKTNPDIHHYSGAYFFRSWNMPFLASHLEKDVFHQSVIDETGLQGSYYLALPGKLDDLDLLNKALLDQLGLELVPSREPIELLVVEKVK